MSKAKGRSPFASIVFLIYAGLMLALLFDRSVGVAEGVPYWEQIRRNCNFVPWQTVGNYWDILTRPEYYMEKFGDAGYYRYQVVAALANILGNVVLFVPFGVFLPLLWKRMQKAWKAILTGTLSIVVVEACQLLSLRGRCDIDDLLLNVLGIMVGYGLWRATHRTRKKKKS